jgi:hypothetical protein
MATVANPPWRQYLYLAGTVVLFYDVFLTLADEVRSTPLTGR